MTRDEWRQVKRVFTKAADLEGALRTAYLKRECRSERFRHEVDSLLAQHDKAEEFPGVYSSVGNRVLSHYEIFERIGEGGMAAVYKARDTNLDRWVALKVLQPWAMGSAASQECLLAEARAVSALNHPNIVTVHGVEHAEGVWFIVMEYITGKTLDHYIPLEGMPTRKAVCYAIQIADALFNAHAQGVLHGDLKPLNVMITDTARVKILDFGLAKALRPRNDFHERSSRRVNVVTQFGTKPYMAPEQLRNPRQKPDLRSDIFSFGLILYNMFAGHHPFGSGTREQLAHAIQTKSPAPLPGAVPASLRRIIACCLQKDPEQRFATMAEVYAALTSWEASRGGRGGHTQSTGAIRNSERLREISDIIARIGYENIPQSHEALQDLASALKGDASDNARQAVVAALKELIQSNVDLAGGVIPASIRDLRKASLELLKMATRGPINACFRPCDLEYLDLYGMNFASERLAQFSFKRCFLVEADFRQSRLRRTSFAGACLRNADFALADLRGADLTGADWFNALNLTEAQLKSVRKDTVMACPADLPAMYEYLANRYVVPFRSWSGQVQEHLKATWDQYLRPNGLRQVVVSWRKQLP